MLLRTLVRSAFLILLPPLSPGEESPEPPGPARLDAFVGNYTTSSGKTLVIRRRGDDLVLLGGKGPEKLRRVSDAQFEYEARTWTFEPGTDGSVTGLLVSWKGQELRTKKTPIPFRLEAWDFKNGDVRLSGTLAIPATPGPHPAVVMAHGSGYGERDDIVDRESPFTHLVLSGVAVLTYDKRGCGASSGNWMTASFEDLADDVLAGLHALQGRPDIDPRRIGVFGASQAGYVGPLAAVRSRDVAFVAFWSGPGVKVAELNLLRIRYEMRAKGFPEEETAQAVAFVTRVQAFLHTFEGIEPLKLESETLRKKAWWPILGNTVAMALKFDPALVPAGQLEGMKRLSSNMLDYDPVPVLEKLECPLLAQYGERDLQVPPKENVPPMEAALRRGNRPDPTLKGFPDADHSLRLPDGTLAPGALKTLSDWILARTGAPARTP